MIAVILNGVSLKKKKFYSLLLPVLNRSDHTDIFETKHKGHARLLASEAREKGYQIVFSAGGDGTLHDVVNGLLTHQGNQLPILGILPLGSGNDFATGLGLTCEPAPLETLLKRNPQPIDVGIIECKNDQDQLHSEYFINACSVGMGPATVRRLEKAPSWMGTNMRYLTSIILTFLKHSPEPVNISMPGWTWSGMVRVLAIANGCSFGNKIFIAPDALSDDGILNLFIARDIGSLQFLGLLQSIKKKKKINNRYIQYNTGREFEITSPITMGLEAEGEWVGYLPASVKLAKERLLILK